MRLLFTLGYVGAAAGPLVSGFLAEQSYVQAYTHLAIPLAMLAILGVASGIKTSRAPRGES